MKAKAGLPKTGPFANYSTQMWLTRSVAVPAGLHGKNLLILGLQGLWTSEQL